MYRLDQELEDWGRARNEAREERRLAKQDLELVNLKLQIGKKLVHDMRSARGLPQPSVGDSVPSDPLAAVKESSPLGLAWNEWNFEFTVDDVWHEGWLNSVAFDKCRAS